MLGLTEKEVSLVKKRQQKVEPARGGRLSHGRKTRGRMCQDQSIVYAGLHLFTPTFLSFSHSLFVLIPLSSAPSFSFNVGLFWPFFVVGLFFHITRNRKLTFHTRGGQEDEVSEQEFEKLNLDAVIEL